MPIFDGLKKRLSTRTPSNQMAGSSKAPFNTNFQPPVDQPPAYTPAPAPAAQAASANTSDDAYAFLSEFDTIVVIDDSGSMAGSRWNETRQALETILPVITAHDADGIDIYFLNTKDSPFYHNVKSAATVREIFSMVSPGGYTPTGQVLNRILKPYVERYKKNKAGTKPINVICITDGVPSDDVESPLIKTAQKLDKEDAPAWQVGVQFFQVGNDRDAAKHLQAMDDEMRSIAGDDELRDIVDTVPFRGTDGASLSGDGILKVVLGAVNRRLDRKKGASLHN